MKKQFTQLCIATALLLGISTSSKAQYSFYLDSIKNVCTVGSSVDVSIRVKSFTKVISYSVSATWDTSVLQIDTVLYSSKPYAGGTIGYGLPNTDSLSVGQYAILWNDPTVNGVTAPDDSSIATLRFTIKRLIVGNSTIVNDTSVNALISPQITIYDKTLGGVPVSVTYLNGNVNFVSQPTISKSGTLLTAVPSGTPSGYQWGVDGSPISGATNISYDYGNKAGSYTVTVNYSNGCTATSAPLLPVILTSFNGYYKSGAAQLSWSTINSNAAYFNVQRSINGKDYINIKQVTTAGSSYSYSDITNTTGKIYYRLQIVDKNGGISYSNIVSLALSSATSISIFPNPVRSTLSLQIQNSKSEIVTVQVVDLLGKVLHQEQSQLSAGLNNVSLNVASLAKGNYVVIVRGESVQKQQFIKY